MLLSEADAKAYTYASAHNDTETAQAFLAGFSQYEGSIEQYAEGFQTAYSLGLESNTRELTEMIETLPKSKRDTVIKHPAVAEAFAAGKRFTEKANEDAAKMKKARDAKKSRARGKFSIDKSIDTSKLSSKQKKFIRLAKLFSKCFTDLNVRIVNSKPDANGEYHKENGSYNVRTNTIEININAGKVKEGGFFDYLLNETLSHETVHYIKAYSLSDYNALKAFLQKHVYTSVQWNNLVMKRLNEYRQGDPLFTYEAAEEEVVANGCQTMLNSPRVLYALVKNDLKLFEKIKFRVNTFFDTLIRKLGDHVNYTVEARVVMQSAEKTQKELERKFIEALRNVRNNTETNSESTQNSESESERKAGVSGETKYSLVEEKIAKTIEKALKQKGKLDEKYNQVRISEFPSDVSAMVSNASDSRISLDGKHIAINGDDMWHEYQRHKDEIVETGRRQHPITMETMKEAVMAIYEPDMVESIFTTTQNPTQRQSFAYAKKSPKGYYIVVEAVGGKRNPNVIPVMLLNFSEEKWNDMMSLGKTLGEMLYENDTELRESLDVEFNKKNRVTAAQFASNQAIANTPHSPRYTTIIPETYEKSNSFSKNSLEKSSNLEKDEIDNYTEEQYNKFEDLYTATGSFIREVHPHDRSSFARSLAHKTSGMVDGEVRTIYITSTSKIYAFRADGYMHGEMIANFSQFEYEKLIEARKEYLNEVNSDRKTADLWITPISDIGTESRGDISLSEGRGRTASDDLLLKNTSERNGTRDIEREWTNPRTEEEYDEIIRKLREIYGFSQNDEETNILVKRADKPKSDIRHSKLERDEITVRDMLATNLEELAETKTEKKRIAEYRGRLDEQSKYLEKIDKLRDELYKLNKHKGDRDIELRKKDIRAEIKALHYKVTELDSELLRLQNLRSLRNVVKHTAERLVDKSHFSDEMYYLAKEVAKLENVLAEVVAYKKLTRGLCRESVFYFIDIFLGIVTLFGVEI